MQQFGPGATSTFLYYFSTTSLVVSIAASRALHVGWGTSAPQQIGLLGGLLAGGLGAYFNRTTSFTIPLKTKGDRGAFLSRLVDTMSQLGYQQKEQDGELYVYERQNLGKYLSGKVFVMLEAEQATIASRAIQVRQVQSALS